MCSNYPGIKIELLSSYARVVHTTQNRPFHVEERTRASAKCEKLKNARAKRAKLLFFILKYAVVVVAP